MSKGPSFPIMSVSGKVGETDSSPQEGLISHSSLYYQRIGLKLRQMICKLAASIPFYEWMLSQMTS